jgi:hypothetical protein
MGSPFDIRRFTPAPVDEESAGDEASCTFSAIPCGASQHVSTEKVKRNPLPIPRSGAKTLINLDGIARFRV